MEKKNTAKKVYQIGMLSTESYDAANTAAKNIAKEVATAFKNETCSISQFCNWLYACSSDSGMFIKDAVLHLAKDAKKEDVFKAFKTAYPFVNESGQLVSKKVLCKGLQTISVITVFDESILNAVISAWLRDVKQTTLPEFFSVDAKTKKVAEIEPEKAESILKDAKTDKVNKDAEKAEKANKDARQLDEFKQLATAFKDAKKIADFDAIRVKYLEILNS